MRAVVFEQFGRAARVRQVADPVPAPHGVVVRVEATGLCRSDWHGWMGHDPDITLPHVPGHEFAGEVVAVGAGVRRLAGRGPGDRALRVRLREVRRLRGRRPAGVRAAEAAGLHALGVVRRARRAGPGRREPGRAAGRDVLRHRGRARLPVRHRLPGGGGAGRVAGGRVGRRARLRRGGPVRRDDRGGLRRAGRRGRRVPRALELARTFGAAVCVDAATARHGGGRTGTDRWRCARLARRARLTGDLCGLGQRPAAPGRHVQVGLLPADTGTTPVPMDRVLALELELLGSHGMAAHAYPEMLELVAAGSLRPDLLVTLDDPADRVAGRAGGDERRAPGAGVTVIEPWR